MEQQKLREILESHRKWLNCENGERAGLSGANLGYANLSDASLCDANLCGANLRGADLRGANLRGANLRGANLCGASLCDANLCGANLRGADLRGANLRGANLRGANLCGANLCDANLCGASLCDANLCGANLCDANLWSCVGERAFIKSIFVSEQYAITYTSDVMQIGCQRHPISDWWEFDDQRIIKMDGKNALKFWREYKDLIRQIIEKCPAKPTNKVDE